MNVKELRDDLIETYTDVKNGKIGLGHAKTRANVAGKILASAKYEMEYNKMMQSSRKIKFFETDQD